MAGQEELLEGLEGEARGSREALLEELLAAGAGEDEIRRAHRAGRLALLPLELVLREEGGATIAEVAARHGVELDALVRTRRALGLPVELEAPIYGGALDNHATRLAAARASGVPVEALVAINRVIGRSIAAVAAASRDLVVATLAEAHDDERRDDERDLAMELARSVEGLVPLMEPVLGYAYREHLNELVREEVADRILAQPGGTPDVRDVAVAFADLVGFTALGGDRGTPQALGDVAQRLEELAIEALRPGVNLVKTIGDEVMLASVDAASLVVVVLDLLRLVEAQEEFPALRAGVAAGPALRQGGDWYGRPVNLASRLTALAQPGTLLADDAARAAAPDAARWTEAGSQEVRGFEGPVATHSTPPAWHDSEARPRQ
jgi:adenylate cyclase